ncbi:MAG: hypothetical protein ACOYCB_00290 [Fastidiosipilaceae bacterium]|jgi:hypothetical protein|nr:hypothetical protein [Clostridiaceae bacterium]
MAKVKETPVIYPHQDGRHLPGAKFMKVIGILAIIFGALGLISNVVGLIGIQSLATMSSADMSEIQEMYNGDFMAQIDLAIAQRSSIIVQIIQSVAQLATGVMAVIFYKKLKLATPPLIGAIVTIILILIANILAMSIVGQFVGMQIISLLLSCIIPVLLIIACVKKDASLKAAKRITIE